MTGIMQNSIYSQDWKISPTLYKKQFYTNVFMPKETSCYPAKKFIFLRPTHKENLADTFRIYHLQTTYFPFTFLSLQETKNM